MAAPFRSLGFRLLRKQLPAANVPANSIFRHLAPTTPILLLQVAPVSSVCVSSHIWLSSKSALYNLPCQVPVKVPYRYGNTTSCPIINSVYSKARYKSGLTCLPVKLPYRYVNITSCPITNSVSSTLPYKKPRPELKLKEISQSVQNLKVSTASQGPIPDATTWQKRMKKYLTELLSKLWQGLLNKIEHEVIEWLLFCIGSCLFFLLGGLVIAILRLFGIELHKKDDSDAPESAENSAILKTIEDLLHKKDGRAIFLKKAFQVQSERLSTLMEINEALSKENEELRAALAAAPRAKDHSRE